MVKTGDRQPAALEMPIHLRHPDRPQHRRASAAFQRTQTGAQGGEIGRGKRLGQNQNLAVCSLYVLVREMFSVKQRSTLASERIKNENQFHLTTT